MPDPNGRRCGFLSAIRLLAGLAYELDLYEEPTEGGSRQKNVAAAGFLMQIWYSKKLSLNSMD
jgi:hypothetical protein